MCQLGTLLNITNRIGEPIRFQLEFIYRDANRFTGLEHCQARSEEKLYFHMNTALTTVSIAKSVHYLSIPKQERASFSMVNVKTLYHNQLLLERFLTCSVLTITRIKIIPKSKNYIISALLPLKPLYSIVVMNTENNLILYL